MKRVQVSAVFAVAALFCEGCVPKPTPTVEYFRSHPDKRVAQIGHCTNDAARSKAEPACVNAREAERLESIGRLRDLPSIGLTPAASPSEDDQQDSPK